MAVIRVAEAQLAEQLDRVGGLYAELEPHERSLGGGDRGLVVLPVDAEHAQGLLHPREVLGVHDELAVPVEEPVPGGRSSSQTRTPGGSVG